MDLLLFTRSLTVLGKLELALQPCQEGHAPVRSEPVSMLLDLGVGRASFGVFFLFFHFVTAVLLALYFPSKEEADVC